MRLRFLIFLFLITPAFAQTGEIVPGDNLVVEGIPKIPASLAEDVSRYTKGRAAELLSWHPVKREMLIVTFFGNTPQVHQVKSPGAARTQLTFYEDRVGRGVSYQPRRGGYFVFSKDTGGDQNYQNYRYDFSNGAITLLTDGKSKNSPGVWSHGGDRQVYGSTRRTGKDVDLYVIDPSNPLSNRMLAQLEGGGWSALDWSPDDRKILAVEQISINESYLWLFDVASGEKTLLTPKGGTEKVSYSSGRFTKDGSGVYVITDKDSEFRRLAVVDLATRRHRFLTSHIMWDVNEFEPSPDGKTFALVTNEDGITTLHLLDAITGKEKPLPGFPAGYVLGLHWHENSRDLGFSLDSARTTTDAYSLDIKTGKVERWTFSETGGLDTQAFVDPEVIRWKGYDGRTISGVLYRPPARFQGKRPVIIDIHGGPEGQFQPYFLGPQNYYLNELGVVLLFPNIRGSSGYGKSFLKLDNGVLREDAYKDIGALLDWIKAQPGLDADRIMVTGVSYGGHMALVTATRYPERIRCAIDIVGPSSLVTFLENTAAYRRDLRRVEYGDERDPETRAFLERTAPLKNASRITKPLFVIQGKNDPIVPPSESEQMIQAVRKNGVPVWYLMAKDEGHGFFKKSNSDYKFYATVLFIREYLLK
ncbi:MAG TPA: prolyl oligopeptidase family serine peptidase [Blastocatellia bacterium]|nr:prolyl oligopeptidase family serine peptidase [Blastocatellia bacterium]